MSTSMKRIIAQHWDLLASKYPGRVGYYLKTDSLKQAWLETLAEVVGRDTSLKVLDVGTGPGFLALLFAELRHECTGVDFSREMIKIAREEAEKKGVKCDFRYGDAEELPFENETFDVVANRHLLWTLTRPGKAVREWMRVLKPGGKMLIMDGEWTDDSLNLLSKFRYILGRCIITVTKRRIAWNRKGRDKELESQLPFRGADQGKVIALMEAAGIKNITVPSIEKLLREDVKVRPLGYRLIYNFKRYMVVGQK